MLHDILFALLGFTGDFITEVPLYPSTSFTSKGSISPSNISSSSSIKSSHTNKTKYTLNTNSNNEDINQEDENILTTFRVVDGYTEVNDGDRELINKIVPLGWYYLRFQDYIKKYEISIQSSNKNVIKFDPLFFFFFFFF